MSQPRLEHLAVAADRPLEQATGRRPPLPIGLWLPPAAAVFGVLAATLALCLSGPQAPAAATPGWRDPHQAPLLIAWLGTLAAVFLAPPLSAADDPNAPRLRFWQRALQAGALGLPITAVVWTFHSIALLLDTTAAVRIPPAALGWSRHLPDGLIAALAVGASAAGAWLWARRWPRAGVVLLTAWAALPPLAWFLSVDVMSRDATAFPGWLTLNPIYAPVLLDRRPQDLPAYAPWVTLAVLFAVPAAAGLWQRLRRRG